MNLSARLALRELRGGLAGLRLLFVCVFLGVATLAGVGSLSAGILAGLEERGREILGGDIEVTVPLRPATPPERAAFAGAGRLSEVVRTRAMVGAGDDRVLAEAKAVDGAYPLYGALTLTGGGDARARLAAGEALVAPALAERLSLQPGDTISVGEARLRVGGVIAEEPDQASSGIGFGPRVMFSTEALVRTGIIQPGSLVYHRYRMRLLPTADPKATLTALKASFPDGGWELRDRSDGAPGLRRFVVQLGQFLTLIGLTALIVAGVGVGNGVTGYMAGKAGTIATLKGLGASGGRITASYLIQIGLITLAAIVAGVVAGGLAPALVTRLAGDALPVAPAAGLYARPLLLGAAYGLLVAATFALVPLARAARASPAGLLRAGVEGAGRPSRAMLGWAIAAAIALVALAIAQANDWRLASAFVGGALALLALLLALAAAIRALARAAPRPRNPLARLALAGLHRPGATAPQLIVALGLGLTLFATLAVIETSLSARIRAALPADAPDLVFIDVPKEGEATIRRLVAATAPQARVNIVPSLRGPVTAVKGVPVSRLGPTPEGAWVLSGDRGLSYAAAPPEGNALVEGEWWPANYSGPPLVSMDVEQARLLGLKLGDKITVAVLGSEIEASIANFRRLDFTRPALQYMFVYDPATLAAAPHSWVATVALPPGADEGALRRAAARALPTASIVDVSDAVGQVNALLAQILFAIRAAAGVTIAAGVAVLVGALAAGRRARVYDSAMLKVLGATRAQVLRVAATEFALLAAAVALVALGVGLAAGWGALTFALQTPFAPDLLAVAGVVATGATVTLALGLAGAWSALSASPATLLRAR